jgi:phosphoenolpyruvate carboxykinase (GTP)
LSGEPPKHLLDWQGNPYEAGKPAAHPNSRFTVSIYNCPSLSKEYDNPRGVPIAGIIFGGRRSNTIPLVCESFNWEHGVFRASTSGSETTTAAAGQVGVVRRDPMAMIPFTGYNMADYFAHWLAVGRRLSHPPKIFTVNWFKKEEECGFLWPGYRENSRVLKWMIDRIHGRVGARETPIGLLPHLRDLDLGDLELPQNRLEELFALKRGEWEKESAEIEQFYSQFGGRIPAELQAQFRKLKAGLGMLGLPDAPREGAA